MSRRAAAVEETRRRIVDATLELHAEQGIAATRWDDRGARRRRRRHGLSALPVARRTRAGVRPRIDGAARTARSLGSAAAVRRRRGLARARVERLVGEVFAIYDRGAHIVRAARREPDVHPDVARSVAEIEAALDALVDAALDPLDVGMHGRRLTRAMVDLWTWTALREQGLDAAETVAAVSAMLACHLDRA